MTEKISNELEKLGFTVNEAKVYLTLLRIGASKAGRIAIESNLERTSTYNALKNLIKEGVISYIIESNKKVFHACDPKKIVDVFYEKQKHASLLIPKLTEIKKYEKEKENITKFRGYSGIKTALNDILNSCKKNEEYLIFGSENQLSEKMPVYAKIYVSRKDRKKLRARILIKRGLKGRKRKMSKYTRVRYVPSNVISPANVNVYSNKILIILWNETPEAVIIEDESAAAAFRSYFEFMWGSAEKS